LIQDWPKDKAFEQSQHELFGMAVSIQGGYPHINKAEHAQTHPPMYYMHKYWARKPHNVVAKYIATYSKEGEIVLDPFCGSGVTPIESLRLNRKVVAIDLDPMAFFITRTTIMPVDLAKFEASFRQIESKVKTKIYELYETECKRCGNVGIISHVVWKQKSERVDDEAPIEIWYHCTCKKDILNKKPTPKDEAHLRKIDRRKIPFWVPKGELVWNTRINVHRGTKVTDLFTRRNLVALSILLHEINKTEDIHIRDLMRFVFTGFVIKSSRMNFINVGGYRSLGRGWALRGYWVPEERMEQNVWNDFAGQFDEVLEGKTEAQNALPNPREATSFDQILDGHGDYLIKNQSALDLSFVRDNSIDYIFTDPPYADSVPYLELHYLWSQWMEFQVNFDDEIIMSDSPARKEKNDFEQYERLVKIAFRVLFDKLKPNHWMTVTFHNSKIYIYNAIIKAAVIAGFDLEKIIYQPPAKPSAKGLLHPYGTANGDYYIRFLKPATSISLSTEEIDRARFERIVIAAVTELIARRGEPTPYTVILNSYADIYGELKKEGYLFSAPEGIEEILKRNLGKTFVLEDNKWWFKETSKVPFIERVPLNERVEDTVISMLNKEDRVSFDKIMEAIFTKFPNALTPETKTVRQILDEYAQQKGGKWKLKPAVKRQIDQHNVMVELVSQIGQKLGFNVIADLPERRVSTLPFDSENPERVKKIDAIWLKGNKPIYEFEVEHSTGFSEGIDRGSNLAVEGLRRVFITPEQRKGKLKRKFKERKFSEEIDRYGWRFIYYSQIEELYEETKSRKGLTLEDLEEKIRLPTQVREERQSSLRDFGAT
jgi:DNA modification methylase